MAFVTLLVLMLVWAVGAVRLVLKLVVYASRGTEESDRSSGHMCSSRLPNIRVLLATEEGRHYARLLALWVGLGLPLLLLFMLLVPLIPRSE